MNKKLVLKITSILLVAILFTCPAVHAQTRTDSRTTQPIAKWSQGNLIFQNLVDLLATTLRRSPSEILYAAGTVSNIQGNPIRDIKLVEMLVASDSIIPYTNVATCPRKLEILSWSNLAAVSTTAPLFRISIPLTSHSVRYVGTAGGNIPVYAISVAVPAGANVYNGNILGFTVEDSNPNCGSTYTFIQNSGTSSQQSFWIGPFNEPAVLQSYLSFALRITGYIYTSKTTDADLLYLNESSVKQVTDAIQTRIGK
jgi:hypothetical protein